MSPEAWHLYCTCLAFFGGTCIGSFLNVCIHRIPREESIISPRSRCPSCERPIPWYENIPLISWLVLHGACRGCKGRISVRYPLVELITGLLFLGLWLKYGPTALTGIYMLAVAGLLLGTFVDLDIMELPDRVTIGGMIAGPILSFMFPEMHGQKEALQGLLQSLIGLAAGFGILQLVRVTGTLMLKQEAMGFGDVKLLGAIGAFWGWQAVGFCIMAGSMLGAFVGITLILVGQKKWGARIPFGPFLAVAAILWVFPGSDWWQRYLTWISGG